MRALGTTHGYGLVSLIILLVVALLSALVSLGLCFLADECLHLGVCLMDANEVTDTQVHLYSYPPAAVFILGIPRPQVHRHRIRRRLRLV